MNDKDLRLAGLCRRLGVEGVWMRRRANVAWITDGADVHCDAGSELGVASVLWSPKRKQVWCDTIEAPRLRAEEFGADWELVERPWFEPAQSPPGRLACDWPEDLLVDLRAPLTRTEVARARALGHEAADVLQSVMLDVRTGWSEHDAAGELAGRLRRRGIQAPVVLVAADARIERFRHPIPTDARCERTMMLVLCAQRRGLIVALTRLVHFGALPGELRRRHAAVCAVDSALHAATLPGTRWCDALAIAQRTYAEQGFADEWELHHQGGPMGYAARDFVATPSETRKVLPHQLVGWNPSISGTKSEDTILSGGEVLTAMAGWPMLEGRADILVRSA